ncbi:MAG: hypothetical protein CM15mP120_18780 [Pseudomonadota bacterium]|nr:MAG: hypothetical protein CM15mP120_18780 [Pseudomonadota bacterium]
MIPVTFRLYRNWRIPWSFRLSDRAHWRLCAPGNDGCFSYEPEEAYKAAVDLGASKALGVHYGTFDLSDEPLAEPAQRFLQASANDPEPGPDPWLPKIGETRSF